MYHRKIHRQLSAGVLIVSLVCVLPVKSQSNSSDEAFARLLKLAKERDKVLAKQQKEMVNRLFTVSRDIMKVYNKGRREEAELYSREGDAFVMIKGSIGRERQIIEEIFKIATYGYEGVNKYGSGPYVQGYALNIKRFNDEASRKAVEARVRLEVAQSKGAGAEQLALMRREIVAYQQVFAALDQEEEMLDRYLAIFGRTSVSEVQKRQDALAEEARARYRRLERERERARENLAALIVAFGVVAALVLILKSPDSTPAERAKAEERLKGINERVRSDCIMRGGIYFDNGPYAAGTCSK